MGEHAYGFILPDNYSARPQLLRFQRSQPPQDLVATVHELLGHDAHENIHVKSLGPVPAEQDLYLPAWYSVVIHNTILSVPFYHDDKEATRVLPSLGGCRIFPYASLGDKWSYIADEDFSNGVTAIRDAKELSRGMTYKWAVLNLLLTRRILSGDSVTSAELRASRMGGGKSVNYIPGLNSLLRDDPDLMRRLCPIGKRKPADLTPFERALHSANAAVVHELQGRYIFAPDMNTDNAVMEYVRGELVRMGSPVLPVACLSEGAGGSGDPSIITAEGVYYGMLGAAQFRWKEERLDGKTIGIQGVGKVGQTLVQRILDDGHAVTQFHIADKSLGALEETKAVIERAGKTEGKDFILYHITDTTAEEDFYTIPMDIFSPNAAGQILTLDHVQRLYANGCRVITGAANNQRDPQQKDDVDAFLVAQDMTYAPDYVINLGGILNVLYERDDVKASLGGGFLKERPRHVIRSVQSLLRDMFTRSRATGIPAQRIADKMVEEHIARHAMMLHYRADDLTNRTYLQI